MEEEEPLMRLKLQLVREFPTLTDQRKGGRYTPHATLSHYANLTAALVDLPPAEGGGRRTLRNRRGGPPGGKKERPTEPATSSNTKVHDLPVPFPGMPNVKEDWVREVRKKLKKRRNGGRSRRGGRNRQRGKRNDPGNLH